MGLCCGLFEFMRVYMPKKHLTLVSQILLTAVAAEGFLTPFLNRREFVKRSFYGTNPFKSYSDTLYQLKKRGWIKFVKDGGEKHYALTEHGVLEALAAKMRLYSAPEQWDGKWRMVIFDIPEDAHNHRDKLRSLLKELGYKYLQGSVWISPHPLDREAIAYLHAANLHRFIRIIKIEEIDDDKDLRKLFNLK